MHLRRRLSRRYVSANCYHGFTRFSYEFRNLKDFRLNLKEKHVNLRMSRNGITNEVRAVTENKLRNCDGGRRILRARMTALLFFDRGKANLTGMNKYLNGRNRFFNKVAL